MRGAALLSMMLILSPSGCVLESVIFGDGEVIPADTWYPTYNHSAYSRSFDNPWVGKSLDELMDALGPPDAIYEARPRSVMYWEAGIPVYTYVYTDRGSRDRCIDAYVVAEPTSTVIKYYCR